MILRKVGIKGFTLIEMLVAVAIVAIISVIATTVYDGVAANARDAKRIKDLEDLQIAYEQYYTEHRKYPDDDGVVIHTDNPHLIEAYFPPNKIPQDPLDPYPLPPNPELFRYTYHSCQDPESYIICAKMERCSGTKCNTTGEPMANGDPEQGSYGCPPVKYTTYTGTISSRCVYSSQ